MQVANPTNMPPRNLLIIVSSAVSTILGLSATSSVGTFVIDQYYLTQNTLRTAFVTAALTGLSTKPICFFAIARLT